MGKKNSIQQRKQQISVQAPDATIQVVPNQTWSQILMLLLRFPFDHPVVFGLGGVLLISGGILSHMSPTNNSTDNSWLTHNPNPTGHSIDNAWRMYAENCKNNFELIYGDLMTAETLVIAEDHRGGDKSRDCARMFKPKKVFFETVPSNQVVSCEDYELPENGENFTCAGWDLKDPAYYKKLRMRGQHRVMEFTVAQIYQQYDYYQRQSKNSGSLTNEQAFKLLLEDSINRFENNEKTLREKFGFSKKTLGKIAFLESESEYQAVVVTLTRLHSIKNQLGNGNTPEKIHANYLSEISQDNYIKQYYLEGDTHEEFAEELLARNTEFFNTLNVEENQDVRKAALIGRGHISRIRGDNTNHKAVHYFWKTIGTSNKYAVLAMLPDTQKVENNRPKKK